MRLRMTVTKEELGRPELLPIIDIANLVALLDELQYEFSLSDDKTIGFHHQRGYIIRAFTEKRLFGLRLSESDVMFGRGDHSTNGLFANNTIATNLAGLVITDPRYMLPCLCIVAKESQEIAEVLWVAERARSMGYGRELVESLGIKYAYDVQEGSENFWDKCRVLPLFSMCYHFQDYKSLVAFVETKRAHYESTWDKADGDEDSDDHEDDDKSSDDELSGFTRGDRNVCGGSGRCCCSRK